MLNLKIHAGGKYTVQKSCFSADAYLFTYMILILARFFPDY